MRKLEGLGFWLVLIALGYYSIGGSLPSLSISSLAGSLFGWIFSLAEVSELTKAFVIVGGIFVFLKMVLPSGVSNRDYNQYDDSEY